ncbi:MAG: aldehyde dehydrogenase family protein, partial [Candidatus Eisenbacteria bacterium]|nr:aldehyde dehydrogenase family protein [Candidatus Eisenbacteria bacterium]
SDPTVEIGPLLTQGRVKEMQKRVQKAVKEGAQILCGGSSPGGELKRGSFFEPTVLGDVSPSMEVCGASLTGPVLSLVTVDSFEEGIHVLNDGPVLPAASLFTRSMERTHRTLRELSAHSISVNQPPTVGGNPKDYLDSLTLTKHIALG